MAQSQNKKGVIVIVSGPSGVGKSTICKELCRRLDDLFLSVSVTTRQIGKDEIDGQDYRYMTAQQFQQSVSEGQLLEHAEVFGGMYGTPRGPVERAIDEGKTVILEIDPQGAKQVKQHYPDAVMVFILPPTHKELTQRLNDRGRELKTDAADRLSGATDEIAAAWQFYQHMVINDDFEQAASELAEIIEAERTIKK